MGTHKRLLVVVEGQHDNYLEPLSEMVVMLLAELRPLETGYTLKKENDYEMSYYRTSSGKGDSKIIVAHYKLFNNFINYYLKVAYPRLFDPAKYSSSTLTEQVNVRHAVNTAFRGFCINKPSRETGCDFVFSARLNAVVRNSNLVNTSMPTATPYLVDVVFRVKEDRLSIENINTNSANDLIIKNRIDQLIEKLKQHDLLTQ